MNGATKMAGAVAGLKARQEPREVSARACHGPDDLACLAHWSEGAEDFCEDSIRTSLLKTTTF